MSKRSELLESIAHAIADYRVAAPTPEHVDRWIRQFEKAVQVPVLSEMNHVLERAYISKPTVRKFLRTVITSDKIAGSDPCSFWKNVEFLDIQGGGASQHEMLEMFDKTLRKQCAFGVDACGKSPNAYLYLDDGLFSGNRVRRDLASWIAGDAPAKTKLHIVFMASHRSGRYYASTHVRKASRKAGKEIEFTWWHLVEIEDRKSDIDTSDVLRPSRIPDDELTAAYVMGLTDAGYPPVLRTAGETGENQFFSSEDGRDLLEQEMLLSGLKIRKMCPNLPENSRPLGYSVLKTLGFGSLVVTFRNCPNNCPLAFWAGDPWYPLFPRKTN